MSRPCVALSRGLLLALLSLGTVASHSASAATLNVPAQYATIQAAITAAVNGDTVLIANGTYTGAGNVDLTFGSKNITVTSVNGAASTIINCGGFASTDGSGNHRGFNLSSTSQGSISGLTIENGYESGGNGGGIFAAGGVTIQNCVIKNNTASAASNGANGVGGGIYSGDSTVFPVMVTGCTLTGNSAGSGGGIANGGRGSIDVTGSTLTGNSANFGGGGIYNGSQGAINVTGSALTGNSASIGGGIYNVNNYDSTVTNCTFTGNSADSDGGGIYNAITSNGSNGDSTVVTACAFTSNTAGNYGGGIYNDNESANAITLTNCTLTGNAASGGGGMNNYINGAGTITVFNCTLTGNTDSNAGQGGGMYNDNTGGTITVTNDIVYGDTGGEMAGGSVPVTYSDIQGGYEGYGNLNADPLFVNAPADLHLQAGSLCLGKGTPINAPITDKDGTTRPDPPSIGAYEVDIRTVTGTTLRSSINPSTSGQSVAFTATVTGTGGTPTGTVAFTVDGAAPTLVTLSSGIAVYTTAGLAIGSHTVTAAYSGSAAFRPSASAPFTQTVSTASATTLTSNINPSTFGQPIILTATVTGNNPTGTVTFTSGGATLGTATLFGAGTALFSTSSLAVGSHPIVASYGGDSANSGSVSAVLTQTVNAAASAQYVSPTGSDSNPGTQAAPKLTIQAAINAATSGQTVTVEDGTYTGLGDVDLDFSDKNLTVTSQNGPAKTVINCGGSASTDGSGNHRGFYIHSGETNAVISGFTIQNGYESNVNTITDSSLGGGICIDSSSVTVQNCILSANTASNSGGGIAVLNNFSGDALTLMNCTLTGNTASTGAGGGLYNNNQGGAITVTSCAFADNIAGSGSGGGVYTSSMGGDITVTNCTFTGNQTPNGSGGGLYNSVNSGAITVTNCTLTGNSASSGFGGGLYNSNPYGGTITLTNVIAYGDTGGELAGGTDPVTDCDIQGGYAGTGNINANPLFVNAPTDLHLQAGSPCLGKGTPSGAPATDKDGTTRPNPPSIGAYEQAAAVLPGRTPLLWDNANGQAALWIVNADSTYTSVLYGPFSGWTAKAVAEAPDATQWLLWTNTDGQISLWHVTALTANGYTATSYGPYTGYTAVSLSVDSDGNPRLLWDKTDGTALLWTINAATGAFTYTTYGPYAGWTANKVACGATVTDLLWTNVNGMADGWRIKNADGTYVTHAFGPYSGFTAVGLSVGPDDGAHLLWDSTGGTEALWNADFATGAYAYTNYGPFSGYAAKAIATGPDGATHMLWDNTSGQVSLWDVTGSGFTHQEFGPYNGWTAVAVSAGP